MPNQIKFVIRFAGFDLPGLLKTFTEPMREKKYNISDISLATGGKMHTTFLTCTIGVDAPSNRWRARKELEDALIKTVRTKYEQSFTEEVVPENPPVEVTFADDTDQRCAFSVYLSIVLEHKAGAINAVAALLQNAFNIKDASDSPLLPPSLDGWSQEALNKLLERRVLWLTLENKATGVSPLTDAVREFEAEIPGTDSKAIKTAAERLAETIRTEIDKSSTGFAVITWSVHVVGNDGTVLYGERYDSVLSHLPEAKG